MDSLFIEQLSEKADNIDKVVDGSENTFNLKDAHENNAVSMMDLLKKKVEEKYGKAEKTEKPKRKKKEKSETEEENTDITRT